MCGIAGFLSPDRRYDAEALGAQARAAAAALVHRGPDDEGLWIDAEAGVALAHRRLAVIDPTPAARQPMASACGRFQIVYNGEIYNYRDMRRELTEAGVALRTDSDTEALLEGAARWGLAETLIRANGMFALALWDSDRRTLTLARDRFGQKPLYYGWLGRSFAFASELKAFSAHPEFAPRIDREALALFLRFNNVPAPRCIFEGLFKLVPGTTLTVATEDVAKRSIRSPRPFWSAVAAMRAARSTGATADPADILAAVEDRLSTAVRECMVADVPVGAFLSGGLDSSTVVALMQATAGASVATFSIGSADPEYDESGYAARVAAVLGTDHHAITVTDADARAVIPDLGRIYDEPFADLSQIPTYLVARLARTRVTVSLSGDGGDELFGGYNRYTAWRRLAPLMAGTPRWMRRSVGAAIAAVPAGGWAAAGAALRPLLGERRLPQMGEKMHKLAGLLTADGAQDYYRQACAMWQAPGALVVGGARGRAPVDDPALWAGDADPAEAMMLLDTVSYLRDDILTKLDRAAMAVGLEARAPFLDHRLFEAAWALPPEQRFGAAGGKPVLRTILKRHLPAALVDRPKMGFAVPAGNWLRGPLRPWAEALLAPARLKREGYLEPAPIAAAWADHRDGRRNRHHELWCVLMFQSWLEGGAAMPAGLEAVGRGSAGR